MIKDRSNPVFLLVLLHMSFWRRAEAYYLGK